MNPKPSEVASPIPDVAVITISPRDRLSKVNSQIQEYLHAGIAEVRVIDPTTRTTMIYRADGSVIRTREIDAKNADPVVDLTLLSSATVQAIQLELIRRTNFNLLNGEKVCQSLLAHRELWSAVILDRVGLPDKSDLGLLHSSGLIKLRDIPGNSWNADTLFILTKNHDEAGQWSRIAEEEQWHADEVYVFDNQQEIDRAIGIWTRNNGLVQVWWD